MKLGPLTQLAKKNKTTSKPFDDDVMLANVMSLSFLEFWPIWSSPEIGFRTESAEVMFSVIVTFYLTKTENRTKKSLTQVSHYCFE